MAYYLDTSAAVKLVVRERGSKAMGRWVDVHADNVVSCDLLRTELLRATRREEPTRMVRARAVLDSVTLLTVGTETFERAAELGPDSLRSLDAIHLASALVLRDELEGMVTYDDRLADACSLHGVTVITPG